MYIKLFGSIIILAVLVAIPLVIYLKSIQDHNETNSGLWKSFKPRKLLIYYAWPSTVNGSNGNVSEAVQHFNLYDDIVFGAGLEIPSHPDHFNTRQIITELKKDTSKRVFGYMATSLSVSTDPDTFNAFNSRIVDWANMGVNGILLDEFGFDYPGVTREKQNYIINELRKYELTPLINAWDPDDAFGFDNISGLRPNVQNGDIYLSESFIIQDGRFQDSNVTIEKAQKLNNYKNSLGIEVFAVARDHVPVTAFYQDIFDFIYNAAGILSYDSLGWNPSDFSAGSSVVENRNVPSTLFYGTAKLNWPVISRRTSGFESISVDLEKKN